MSAKHPIIAITGSSGAGQLPPRMQLNIFFVALTLVRLLSKGIAFIVTLALKWKKST